MALHARLAATRQREPQVLPSSHKRTCHTTLRTPRHKLIQLCRSGGAEVWCSTRTGSVATASGSGSSLSSCPHKASPTLCSITKVLVESHSWLGRCTCV